MEEATVNLSSEKAIENSNQSDEKDLNLTLHNNQVPATQQEIQFTCSLYISRAGSLQDQGYRTQGIMQYLKI